MFLSTKTKQFLHFICRSKDNTVILVIVYNTQDESKPKYNGLMIMANNNNITINCQKCTKHVNSFKMTNFNQPAALNEIQRLYFSISEIIVTP